MINDLAFNSDYSSISVSTDEGHKIFNCEPFGELYSSDEVPLRKSISNSLDDNDDDNKGPTTSSTVSLKNELGEDTDHNGNYPTLFLRMLYSTSLTIIVPKRADNKLLKIFNLKQNLKIIDLEFNASIIDVKLNRKRLVVVLQNGEVHIYDLSCIKLIKILRLHFDKPNTCEFIGDLSAKDVSWLAIPMSLIMESSDLFGSSLSLSDANSSVTLNSKDASVVDHFYFDEYLKMTPKNSHSNGLLNKSQISLKDMQSEGGGWVLIFDTINLRPVIIFKAHDSAIAKITMSSNSYKLATASVKGTILRVFDLQIPDDGDKAEIISVKNLRRGHNLTKINSMSFHNDDRILGCGSESMTIHLFELAGMRNGDDRGNDPPATTQGRNWNDSFSDYDNQSDGEGNRSSSEDLNESLANLLLSKPIEEKTKVGADQEGEHHLKSKSWFSKTRKKFTENVYTNSVFQKIPYKDYFENLIWEPPKRSFAFIKVPEHTVTNEKSSCSKFQIGFCGNIVYIASYRSGIFYQYQLPKKKIVNRSGGASLENQEENEKRGKCILLGEYSLS
ncbi:atg18 [Candida oxycetoniae]|uniref:Atg18 n=1 Tax=Candida oxycetoniae TaxID=497107 RepID=A0AAI9SW88_9ASCO|nr:atg18 [Candida oxycetoniae]KAI3403899.2 atg18 [Candida oxycetoniae]